MSIAGVAERYSCGSCGARCQGKHSVPKWGPDGRYRSAARSLRDCSCLNGMTTREGKKKPCGTDVAGESLTAWCRCIREKKKKTLDLRFACGADCTWHFPFVRLFCAGCYLRCGCAFFSTVRSLRCSLTESGVFLAD